MEILMLNCENNKSKVVLVTGAARRIGAEIARTFHQLNYQVIIHYNTSEAEAHKLASELNNIRAGSAQTICCDLAALADNNYAEQFAHQAIEYYGKIDVLVNNASSFFPTVLGEVSLDMWRDLMISNAGGPFFLSQVLAPFLRIVKGAIINISDIHAIKPLKGYPVYSMAKAANNMLTQSLAKELAPEVRVNAIAPGPILWPEDANELNAEQKTELLNKTLLKKPGCPQDVADAVVFLAQSHYITGQILAVDGGRSIKG